jgi:hypothetical protein
MKAKTKDLKENKMVHFPRRTLMTKKRKSNHQYQIINETTPTKTFNDSKNTKQTKGFSMQIEIVLLKQQANKKH